jgi:hypothetical protein
MIEKIQSIIFKHNPLNFHYSKFSKYYAIIKDISLYDCIDNISEDIIKNKFIDHFGDSYIIFELKKNHNIYNLIYIDILNEFNRKKNN